MPAFKSKTLLLQALEASLVVVGSPPDVPATKARIQSFRGNPNGNVAGTSGDLVIDTDTPSIWQKTGSPSVLTTTGWVQIGTGSTSNADLAYGLRVVGVDPLSPNGSVDTSVILFNAQGTPDFVSLPLADWVEQTNSPTDGTTFRITLPGKYVASLSVPTNTAAPGQNVFSGITIDATGAILTTLACAFMGFSTSIQVGAFNADDSFPAEIPSGAPFFVTREMIDAGRGTIRAHAVSAANAQGAHVGFVLRRMGNATQG